MNMNSKAHSLRYMWRRLAAKFESSPFIFLTFGSEATLYISLVPHFNATAQLSKKPSCSLTRSVLLTAVGRTGLTLLMRAAHACCHTFIQKQSGLSLSIMLWLGLFPPSTNEIWENRKIATLDMPQLKTEICLQHRGAKRRRH